MNNNYKIISLPKFLILLSFVEMWERFSYYGMRVLLVIFMTSVYGFSDPKAYAIYSIYAALSYAGPVLGGLLADRLMGFQKMVILGGIVSCMGHIGMACSEVSQTMFYIGLGFIAFGSGMFKGNISNLLGSYYSENDAKRSSGFTIFYIGVNLGGFLSSVLCGYVAYLYGWHYGFGLAGIGMLLGIVVLLRFRDILEGKGLPPKPKALKKSWIMGLSKEAIVWIGSVVLSLVCAVILRRSESMTPLFGVMGLITLVYVIYEFSKQSLVDKRNILLLGVLTLFFVCFFALEMQLGSLIALFTERNVDSVIFGFTVPSSVSQAMNPLSIVLLGTLVNQLWIKIGEKYNSIRFGAGLVMMSLSFLSLYVGCLNATDAGLVNYSYLVLAVLTMGIGELCIAPLMLSLCTLLAPKKLKGFFMGISMLSLAFANLAGILIAKFMSVPTPSEGIVTPLVSLNIYQEGFFKIMIFTIILSVVYYLIVPFIDKIITKNKYKENEYKQQNNIEDRLVPIGGK